MRSIMVSAFVVCLSACSSDPKPPPKSADDGVPANSSAENRLQGEKKEERPAEKNDPTQPLMTPVGAGGGAAGGAAAGAGGGDDDDGKPKKPKPGKTGPVSKQECNEALDHGLDLMVASDPRFQGIPPEMLQQFKSQAMKDALRDHAGQNPCGGKGITRAEYDCEMAATSSDDFRKCEKRKK